VERPSEIRTCYVCVNLSCAEGGSEAILKSLSEKLEGSGVEVKTQVCFGACWTGPNVVLHPNGTWYNNVSLADVDDIVAHIQGGEPVDRLINKVDPQLHELVLSILDAGLG
jgi:(2Fe-2S) ferredoxin